MNFDYICKHVSVGEWGTGDGGKERIREGERGSLIFRPSLRLFVSLSLRLSFSIPTQITFSPPRLGRRAGRKREPGGGDNLLTRGCLPSRPPLRRRRGLRPRRPSLRR